MQHSQGQTATTRRNCEFELVFSQKADSIEIARGAERRIKSWKRSDFIEKIISEGRISFLDDVGH